MLSTRFRALCLLLPATACAACRTVDRAGQDALVVGTFPIHAVTTPYAETAKQLVEDGASPWMSPLIFAGHLAEDVGVTVISAGDLGVSPAYGIAELAASESAGVRPLRMYTFEQFPPRFHKSQARGVESDVAKGAATAAVAVAYVGVIFACGYYGHGCGTYDDWPRSTPTCPR